MLSYLLFTVAPLALSVAAKPLQPRAAPDESTLFAYGPSGVGGFPIVNIGGYAYIDGRILDRMNTTIHNVSFTATDDTLVANTNNQTLLMGIPENGPIRFVIAAEANSSLTTTGLGWYGKMLFLLKDGKMETLWDARPTEEDLVFQLDWNITGNPPLDIRNVPPSAP